MNPVGALIIFILVWWITFFAVLPWGIRGRWESEDDGIKGAEPGAPTAPELKKKIKQTTVIALGLWILTILIILSGIISTPE